MASTTEEETNPGGRNVRRITGEHVAIEDSEPRVERRSKSWSDVLDPKTMLLIGVAILSGNGSKLGEVLGLAPPPKIEAPAPDPLTEHRIKQLETHESLSARKVDWLVRNQALIMQKLRVPMSGEPPQ